MIIVARIRLMMLTTTLGVRIVEMVAMAGCSSIQRLTIAEHPLRHLYMEYKIVVHINHNYYCKTATVSDSYLHLEASHSEKRHDKHRKRVKV